MTAAEAKLSALAAAEIERAARWTCPLCHGAQIVAGDICGGCLGIGQIPSRDRELQLYADQVAKQSAGRLDARSDADELDHDDGREE